MRPKFDYPFAVLRASCRLVYGVFEIVSHCVHNDATFRTSPIPRACRPMKRTSCLQACVLGLLGLAGCHFRAGFGPAPSARPSVEHSLIRDTTETKDGGKTINETDKTTTTFEGGRSTTLETVNVTVTQPDGTASRTTTQTTTERSSNGTVSTSSSSSSH